MTFQITSGNFRGQGNRTYIESGRKPTTTTKKMIQQINKHKQVGKGTEQKKQKPKKKKTKRNIRETKPENITEDSKKEISMGCSRFVETSVQCGSCYRQYHYKCEGTTEKEIRKLYPEEAHYIIYKRDQNSN